MADKAECLACNSYTSDILRARRNGEACPHCGLPAEAALAIEQAMERGANEQLVQRAAAAEKRAADAEAEAGRLRGVLQRARWLLDEVGQAP